MSTTNHTGDPGDTARSPAPLRIVLVDDSAVIRRGLRELLNEEADMCVVGEAGDGEEGVRLVRKLRPQGVDLVLMDVDMPKMDGITATQRIVAEHPGLPVIILTVSSMDRDLFATARAGAVGFLSKSLSPSALARALRDYHREGALPMAPTMATRLLTHLQQAAIAAERRAGAAPTASAAPPHNHETSQTADAVAAEDLEHRLTPREREVLELIGQGARDRDIAQRLVLAERTVKKHVQNILDKLGARSRTEVIARFLRYRS